MLSYIWFSAFFAFLFFLAVFDYLKNAKYWRCFASVPGFKPRPILGSVPLRLFRATDLINLVADLFQVRLGVTEIFRQEGLYHFWVGRKPIVMLTSAKTAEVVLSSKVSIDKSSMYEMGSEWVGDGLATSSGDMWRRDRKQLTPTFHFRILEDFLPVMNEQASILVQKLKRNAVGKPWIDLETPSRLCALDIILETSMGIRLGAQTKDSSYASNVQSVTMMMTNRLYRPWLHSDFVFYHVYPDGKKYKDMVKEVNQMTDMLIGERRKKKQTIKSESADDVGPGKKRLALLDLLLDTDLTEKEIRDQVSTFVFAGHHTISVSFVWLLYVIGLYPEVQAKLMEELNQVFNGDRDRHVTQEDLKQLKYMTCVMKETQRLYPTAPIIARELLEDTKIGDHVIPKGTDCGISIASIHRDPEHYPNPEIFDPNRFLSENATGRHPYAFVPFSAGPRNCIGQRYAQMELKTSLSHVLRSFRLRSLDPRDKVKVIPDMILRPVDKIRIEITDRE